MLPSQPDREILGRTSRDILMPKGPRNVTIGAGSNRWMTADCNTIPPARKQNANGLNIVPQLRLICCTLVPWKIAPENS